MSKCNQNASASSSAPISPISNYDASRLTAKQAQLLSKMGRMGAAPIKALPPATTRTRDDCADASAPAPRRRNPVRALGAKYNVESALYMLEPWERYMLNAVAISALVFLCRSMWGVVESFVVAWWWALRIPFFVVFCRVFFVEKRNRERLDEQENWVVLQERKKNTILGCFFLMWGVVVCIFCFLRRRKKKGGLLLLFASKETTTHYNTPCGAWKATAVYLKIFL